MEESPLEPSMGQKDERWFLSYMDCDGVGEFPVICGSEIDWRWVPF